MDNKHLKATFRLMGNCKVKWAGALGLWLWEETQVLQVVGLNHSTVYWMDIFSHMFVTNVSNKNKRKRGQGLPILKKNCPLKQIFVPKKWKESDLTELPTPGSNPNGVNIYP